MRSDEVRTRIPQQEYEVVLSFRIAADNDEDAAAIAHRIGDRGLDHPCAIDVSEQDVRRV